MKKKLLLLVLPVLMALSGCSGVKAQPKAEFMIDSTVANEEVFGEAEVGGDLGLRKGQPLKGGLLPADTISLGYQIRFNENDEGTADDTISIRFVAALKTVDGINAFWMRALAEEDGTNTAKPFANKESTKYYRTLANGANVIEAGKGDYAAYEGFVVYTLMNIPYESYKNAYLGASLVLTNPSEDNAVVCFSDFLAVRVEKLDSEHSKDAFAFDGFAYNDKYFLHGIINNSGDRIMYDEDGDANTLENDKNHASYIDVEMKEDDYFGSFYFSSSAFLYFAHDTFFAESASTFDESDVLEGFNSPKEDGVYTLYVSKGEGKVNHVYTGYDGASHLYTATSVPNWLDNDSAVLFVQVKRFNYRCYWVSCTYNKGAGTITFNAPDNIKEFLIARCATGTTEPSWTTTGDAAGRIYNKTGDIGVSSGNYSYEASDFPGYNP